MLQKFSCISFLFKPPSALRFFTIRKMSFLLIVIEFKHLSVLCLNFFQCTCIFDWSILGRKMRIQKFDFILKSDTSLPSARTVGMTGIFFKFENLLMMDQYVFGAVPRLSNLTLILATYYSFAWIINLVHSFA